jgi:hypothetical protein
MHRLGVEPTDLTAQKGDVLVWTSNLLHGGRAIRREGSTRWSQVTHYFFEDCLYFQPIYSNYLTGEIKLLHVIDLNTLEGVEHRYGDQRVVTTKLADGRQRLAIVDSEGHELAGDVQRVQQLQVDLDRLVAEVDKLHRSASFRLGHAVVGPLSALRRRLR